jgi:transmembrane sensor
MNEEQVIFTDEELDEAAVWIARLHAPDRSVKVERGFQRWRAEKRSHEAAFATVSNAWELSGALQRRPFPKVSRWERAGFRAGFWRSTVAVACAAALCCIGVALYLRTAGVVTGIGEQRVLVLEDGTRVSLNTDSRLVVHFDRSARRVELDRGEALFEVTADPARPFIVAAGHRQIEALGTSFIVREEDHQLSVTLVEGKVAVSADDRAAVPAVVSDAVTLTPGERLTFKSDVAPAIDRPSLEKVTAWRRGQVDLEETPLADAATEMNRYSTLKLRIEQATAAGLPVDGVFRAGDTEGFAEAVARSYGLGVERRPHEIVLTGIPAQKSLSLD